MPLDQHTLLTDEDIKQKIANPAKYVSNIRDVHVLISLLLEVREYRKVYGPLGVEWLSIEEGRNA